MRETQKGQWALHAAVPAHSDRLVIFTCVALVSALDEFRAGFAAEKLRLEIWVNH